MGGDWSCSPLFRAAAVRSVARGLAMSLLLGVAPGYAAEPSLVTAGDRLESPDPIRDRPSLEGVGIRALGPGPLRLSAQQWSGAAAWSPAVSVALDTQARRAGVPEWLEEESEGSPSAGVGDAYLEWTLPPGVGLLRDTTVRVGQFWTLLGAGMIDVTGPASISRFGVPLNEGGVLATRPFGDRFSLTAGFVRSWDRLDGTPGILAVANASWTVNWRLIFEGNLLWDPQPRSPLQVADLVAMFYPLSSLTCFIDVNSGQDNGADPSQPATAWHAAAAVASYPFSRRGAVAVSGEWLERIPLGPSRAESSWALSLSTTYDITPRLFGELRYRTEGVAAQHAPLGRESGVGVDGIVEASIVKRFD